MFTEGLSPECVWNITPLTTERRKIYIQEQSYFQNLQIISHLYMKLSLQEVLQNKVAAQFKSREVKKKIIYSQNKT